MNVGRVASLGIAWVLLGACSKEEARPATIEGGPSAVAPQATASAPAISKPAGFDFAGTLDGKPVEFRSAVVAKRPNGEALHVLVSTHARTCADLAGSYRMSEGETIVRFAVASNIATGTWHVEDTYFSSTSSLGERPWATTVSSSDPSKDLTIAIDGFSVTGFHREKLEARGAIVAKGCGEVEEKVLGPGAPGPARPQTSLRLSVAGKTVPVLGARYMEKTKDVVLSSSPLSCTSSYSYADVTLIFDGKGKDVNVQGFRIGDFNGVEPKPPPTIKLGTATNGELPVTIKGSFKKNDMPIEISGTANLRVCSD